MFATAVLVLIGTRTPIHANIPGGQNGFLLGGTAQNALDPENSSNQVIRINTTPPIECTTAVVNCPSGTVSRHLEVKIAQLDNLLEFKSYFLNRSCGGGWPRIQLLIDVNGDGMPDGNAFGYTAPPFAGCVSNRWQNDDLTDELPRWDISQLAAAGLGFPGLGAICTNPLFATNPVVCPFQTHSGYIPWQVFETVLTTLFPAHTVCGGALVDDSPWSAAAAGVAYYDVISIGKATWTNWGDTAGRGFARGCVEPDHGDDNHAGDDNHDHKVDDGDRDWRERHN
jgi:hypothetical protein